MSHINSRENLLHLHAAVAGADVTAEVVFAQQAGESDRLNFHHSDAISIHLEAPPLAEYPLSALLKLASHFEGLSLTESIRLTPVGVLQCALFAQSLQVKALKLQLANQPACNVLLYANAGTFVETLSDRPINLTILDADTEDGDEENIVSVGGNDYYMSAFSVGKEAAHQAIRVDEVLREIGDPGLLAIPAQR